MVTTWIFDVLCPADRYARVSALHLVGGGVYRVQKGTLARRHDARNGEMLTFTNGDGGGAVRLCEVVGVELPDGWARSVPPRGKRSARTSVARSVASGAISASR